METPQPAAVAETPLTPEHRAAGAELANYSGCLLPKMFSDLEGEFRAARETVALFDTSWRAILWLTGRDRVKYLHAISSNNIKDLAENYGVLALLLNPQGRILAELEIYALKEELLVFTHVSARERTFTTLKKYVIGSQVQIADDTDRFGSIGLEGPQAATVVAQITGLALSGFSEFALADVQIDGVDCRMVRRSHFGGEGVDIIAPREHLAIIWHSLHGNIHAVGGRPIGMETIHALRLEARVPWFPADFNDGMIPHEAALENTHISFNKGCYTGQEIVERVRSRGHVNRKRVSLKFSVATPPTPGTKLSANGAEIGFVTSSAFSPSANSAIGMGYVRKEQFAPGSMVDFEGGSAEVIA